VTINLSRIEVSLDPTLFGSPIGTPSFDMTNGCIINPNVGTCDFTGPASGVVEWLNGGTGYDLPNGATFELTLRGTFIGAPASLPATICIPQTIVETSIGNQTRNNTPCGTANP
jgi:hypothetical protein